MATHLSIRWPISKNSTCIDTVNKKSIFTSLLLTLRSSLNLNCMLSFSLTFFAFLQPKMIKQKNSAHQNLRVYFPPLMMKIVSNINPKKQNKKINI